MVSRGKIKKPAKRVWGKVLAGLEIVVGIILLFLFIVFFILPIAIYYVVDIVVLAIKRFSRFFSSEVLRRFFKNLRQAVLMAIGLVCGIISMPFWIVLLFLGIVFLMIYVVIVRITKRDVLGIFSLEDFWGKINEKNSSLAKWRNQILRYAFAYLFTYRSS